MKKKDGDFSTGYVFVFRSEFDSESATNQPSTSAKLKQLPTSGSSGVKIYRYTNEDDEDNEEEESTNDLPDLDLEEEQQASGEDNKEDDPLGLTNQVKQKMPRKLGARQLLQHQMAQENLNKQEIHDLR